MGSVGGRKPGRGAFAGGGALVGLIYIHGGASIGEEGFPCIGMVDAAAIEALKVGVISSMSYMAVGLTYMYASGGMHGAIRGYQGPGVVPKAGLHSRWLPMNCIGGSSWKVGDG